jgi:uncharacterized protein
MTTMTENMHNMTDMSLNGTKKVMNNTIKGTKVPDVFEAIRKGTQQAIDVITAYPDTISKRRAKDGMTPLYLATLYGDSDLVETILGSNAREGFIWTKKAKIPSKLVSIDLKIKRKGTTALMQAIYSGYDDIAQMLILSGSNVFLKDSANNSALSYAVIMKRENIVRNILDMMPKLKLSSLDTNKALTDELLRIAVKHKNGDVLKLYGQFKPNKLNEKRDGGTLLIDAAKNDDWELINVLLDAGADKYITNGTWGAMYYAISRQNKNAVEALLAHDFDHTRQDVNGNTILHHSTFYDNAEIAECIFTKATYKSLHLKNTMGDTPMDLAKLVSHKKIIEVIEKEENWHRRKPLLLMKPIWQSDTEQATNPNVIKVLMNAGNSGQQGILRHIAGYL